ncbi:zinc-binding alcohol dehydrogenase family protein [Citrobacter portucalensis]|uniref:zinc-binding alcohol dehydrogenase family protein n=1 Tax=Citrobacter portucalensis TaxID=1639133 RepID=UPI00226B3F5A|nr:zinc-binding alcohol dehydrogenase family protein [Citrobacter portucalensis]MCX8985713.1 zinc-binding alcohol dehydrogenase family protein [Citrobacter portucalensis]MCX9059008.1 zinc-binding alcohol dehydrogenase family protein [Citrobacter portucalensis]
MDSEMNSWVCEKPGVLQKQRIAIPTPGAGEVLIRMRALGICGSDVHAFHGDQPMFNYPKVMGHEVCGEVVSCGEQVQGMKPGQMVIVIPYKHCGRCYACRRGRTTCCTSLSVLGVHFHGAMQEYIVMDVAQLLVVEDIDAQDAALIEPYAIGAHALSRSGATAKDTLLVVGAGAIGLGIADIAVALGIRVILAEVNEQRLEQAKQRFGFMETLNPQSPNYAAELLALTEGDGPGVIIDATGNAASMNSQFAHLAASGTIVFVGLHKGEVNFTDLIFHKRETTLHGSRAATIEDFKLVIRLMAEKRIHPHCMRDNVLTFDQLSQAKFSDLIQPTNTKSVITFE